MIDPASGPFLFDTSAEGWLARSTQPEVVRWWQSYLGFHQVAVSAVTVVKRIRGYGVLWRRAAPQDRELIDAARVAYLTQFGEVLPTEAAVAMTAGEIMALLPEPPTPPRRSHRLVESRQERMARWRFDQVVAATALVSALPLVRNNGTDFEANPSGIEGDSRRFPSLGPLELIPCSLLTQATRSGGAIQAR